MAPFTHVLKLENLSRSIQDVEMYFGGEDGPTIRDVSRHNVTRYRRVTAHYSFQWLHGAKNLKSVSWNSRNVSRPYSFITNKEITRSLSYGYATNLTSLRLYILFRLAPVDELQPIANMVSLQELALSYCGNVDALLVVVSAGCTSLSQLRLECEYGEN